MATIASTAAREATRRPPSQRQLRRTPVGVWVAAGVVVALRLPFVGSPLGSDEAGYLAVAQQWHSGGSSLYGNYWVDRPPLLITIFRAAALLGGTVPLRLIGIGAAVVAVLAVGRTAGILAGRGAATWAALAASAFLVSPLAGASEVNGELLAAPFVAVGIAGLVEALMSDSPRRAAVASGLAGVCGVAAVLVKQNMLDVLVFGGTLALLTARTVGPAHLRRVAAWFVAGGLLAAVVMALWTLAHGTSLSGVWFAMYQFRVEADRVMSTYPSAAAVARQHRLLLEALENGMVIVAGLLAVVVSRRRHDHPTPDRASAVARAVPWALVATLAYGVVSIYLGQGFWVHYLVQLAVPLAITAGLAFSSRPRLAPLVVGLAGASAVAAVLYSVLQPPSGSGDRLGQEIGAVACPNDTIITVWGHAEVTRSSGLRSPYPYLWYLPERTLDPELNLLDATLQRATAPVWLVTWSGTGLRGVDTSTLSSTLAQDYYPVAYLEDATVYLHDGVDRAPLTTGNDPTLPTHQTATDGAPSCPGFE
jgi:hypothetical protein